MIVSDNKTFNKTLKMDRIKIKFIPPDQPYLELSLILELVDEYWYET